MVLNISFWLSLTVATLSVGESSALLIGMRNSAGPAPWMTNSNIAYAISDIALGLALGVVELRGKGDCWSAKAALGAIVLSNGARAIEYFARRSHPFCANGPLLVFDIAKLGLATGALGMTF
jgi:hypothetical protein